ncbi:unnamed protein product [Strongylus vulgaris]|uniref:Uncharacterized protein n=1 Tax=Strongylus vulgaris TaxID=40348 RepID=A0A3P7IQ98_STRVU|nr:unnamed protein product [Strongylus vulgaris]
MWYVVALVVWATSTSADFNCSEAPGKDMQTTCQMIQEWDKDARKAITRRQAFESNIGKCKWHKLSKEIRNL